MTRIPLLLNHDHTKVIGWFGDNWEIHIPDGLERELLFNIFGGAGIIVVEQEIRTDRHTGRQTIYVIRAQILEFSLCPNTAVLI